MNTIYIARHGQNEDNAEGILNGHRDRPLTEIGVNQAKQLAKHILTEGITFAEVFSSPLIRSYVTAEIITDTLGLKKPVVMNELIERDFGIMTGKLISDIEALCAPDIIKTDTITYFLSPNGAETFLAMKERGAKVLQLLSKKDMRGNILLVCHGDIGKMIYASFYNLDWKEVLTDFHFGNSELLLLDHTSEPSQRHVLKLEQHNH